MTEAIAMSERIGEIEASAMTAVSATAANAARSGGTRNPAEDAESQCPHPRTATATTAIVLSAGGDPRHDCKHGSRHHLHHQNLRSTRRARARATRRASRALAERGPLAAIGMCPMARWHCRHRSPCRLCWRRSRQQHRNSCRRISSSCRCSSSSSKRWWWPPAPGPTQAPEPRHPQPSPCPQWCQCQCGQVHQECLRTRSSWARCCHPAPARIPSQGQEGGGRLRQATRTSA